MELSLPTEQLRALEEFFHLHFDQILKHGGENENKGHFQLIEAIKYSLFSGGKRFRPSIGLLLGGAMNLPTQRLLPWLAAVECIHTYSLIHDDLPSMDNDSLRRGKPTNHVVFGEATALLAGDALLTEAFAIIGKYYLDTPEIGVKLVQTLALAAGAEGMVGGQAMDLAADMSTLKIETAELIHQLKTGALIRSVTEGVAIIARCSQEDSARLIQFGSHLGLAFQLKDDLLDFDPQVKDAKNVACHIGTTKTKEWLETISKRAEEQIRFLDRASTPLIQLIEYNARRTH
ncbi:MAG: hypothetical protein RJB66_1719 [Pseudomonadota bacterium]|jgi:geranylgeranyl diphosphate synthase type II